jgi:hypothetical protein
MIDFKILTIWKHRWVFFGKAFKVAGGAQLGYVLRVP